MTTVLAIIGKLLAEVGADLITAGTELAALDTPTPPPAEPPDPEPLDPEPPNAYRLLSYGPVFPDDDKPDTDQLVITNTTHGHLFRSVDPASSNTFSTTPVRPQPGAPRIVLLKRDTTGRAYIERWLEADGADNHHATTAQDQHVKWITQPSRHIIHTHEFLLRDTSNYPWEWGKTLKIGGPVGFNNGNWDEWPGGGRGGPDNASVRTVINRWFPGDELPDNPPDARLAVYAYIAEPLADDVGGPRPSYSTDNGGGQTVQWDLDTFGVPPLNHWIKVTYEIVSNTPGNADGRMAVTTQVADSDGVYRAVRVKRLTVSGIKFFGTGPRTWNRDYLSPMFGGPTVDYAPYNERRGCWVAIGQHQTEAVEPIAELTATDLTDRRG